MPADKQLKDNILGNQHIITSVVVMIIAVAFIVGLFRSLYRSASDNILRMWETKAIQMARSAEYYLARPADAIEFTAVQVENMIDAGQSNGEIKDMLIREMETYAPLVDSNYTGVYGYVRSEYRRER